MATRIQLRRVAYADRANATVEAEVLEAGEPMVVFPTAANQTPRIYIGSTTAGFDIDAGAIGLGGPNSVTVDQIRGLGSTTPNGANFGSSGTANRVILLDANGVASLSQLNTQSTSGNTTLTMTGDLTVGDIDVDQTDGGHDENGVIVDDVGLIQIQRAGASATDNVIETYQGSGDGSANKKLQIAVDGDFEGVKDVKMTGKLGVGAQGANLEGTFIHCGETTPTLAPNANADDIFIESSGHTGITIASGATNTGNIYFGKNGDDDVGGFIFQHHGSAASTSLQTRVDGATKLTLTGEGNLTATGGVSGTTLTASSTSDITGASMFRGGIRLQSDGGTGTNNHGPSDQALETSNLLRFYSEGQWNSVFTATSGGALTLSSNAMRYIRIGDTVTVYGGVTLGSNSGKTGDITISGLPYNVHNHEAAEGGGYAYVNWDGGSNGGFMLYAKKNTATIIMESIALQGGPADNAADILCNAASGNRIHFNITYLTDAATHNN